MIYQKVESKSRPSRAKRVTRLLTTLSALLSLRQRRSGWAGIRTQDTLTSTPVFKTGAFNHSATHPRV